MNIADLAGVQRAETFVKAFELAVAAATASCEQRHYSIVETGCYRGIDADGQSTVILAKLSAAVCGEFVSVDKDLSHVVKAREKLRSLTGGKEAAIIVSDSVEYLSLLSRPIDFLYLDSYDYEPDNPLPAQIHQVAEIGAAFGKLSPNAIVLLDDCNIPGGGKGILTERFLIGNGFHLIADAYQKLFVR